MTSLNEAKRDIQGFITSGLGHTYAAAYLFLRVTDVEKAKAWLKQLVPQVLTAESWRKNDQPCAPGEERPPKIYPERIISIAFSFEGLAAIGLSDATLRTFPGEFQQGMAAGPRSLGLGDIGTSAPDAWQIGNPASEPYHILLLLHAGMDASDPSANQAEMQQFADEVVADLQGVDVVYTEFAYRRYDDKEHFGFKDGISQPRIQGINLYDGDGKPITDSIATGEFILGYINAFGLFPTVPVVAWEDDPNNILPLYNNPRPAHPLSRAGHLKDFGANGTYLVYRKMTQNVPAFWQFIREEVERMDGAASVERMLWLASKMVGRTPNGDPLVPDVAALKHQNDFNFAKSDADGQHCPFGSHLRRTNPRDSFHPLGAEEAATTTMKHRILRRGRIYGESLFDLKKLDSNNAALLGSLLTLEDDGGERGLHFICVNASISRQFEFIQTNWANNPHFNGMYQSKDPIIGDNGYAEQPASYMHIPDDACRVRTRPLPRFVDVLGGGYFFMPSLTALRFLAQ
ncbi:MAG: hypothetical protein KC708_15415 [Anaerolineae bacterium]|nr:hypothetical protein [Anaerolineae bacterium]